MISLTVNEWLKEVSLSPLNEYTSPPSLLGREMLLRSGVSCLLLPGKEEIGALFSPGGRRIGSFRNHFRRSLVVGSPFLRFRI